MQTRTDEKTGLVIRSDGKVKQWGMWIRGAPGKYTHRMVFSPITLRGEYVHIIAARNFVPNPMPKLFNEVDHIDGNPSNNNISNLRWLSTLLNHAARMGVGASQYKHFRSNKTSWLAKAKIMKHQYTLGYWSSKFEASTVYRSFKELAFHLIYLYTLPKEKHAEAGHRAYIRADPAGLELALEFLVPRVRRSRNLRKAVNRILSEYSVDSTASINEKFQM